MKLYTFSYVVKAQNKMQCVCKLAHAFVRKFQLNKLEGVRCKKKKNRSEGRGSVGELLQSPLPTKVTPQHANSYFENIYNIKAKETCCAHENSMSVFSFAFIIFTSFLFAFLKKRRYLQFSIWKSTWIS